MFRAILATQWKWTRGMLLVATCLTFALPLLAMRAAGHALAEANARDLLTVIHSFGVAYAISAAVIGLLIAASAWTSDHAGRHVYALSLPVQRWKYVAMRFGAGAATLVAPVVALWIGALVAVSAHAIPAGLHAYPVALAVRFALALLLSYAVFFAISSGTKRTAGMLLAILGGIILVEIVSEAFGVRISLFSWLIDVLMDATGLFGVFNSRWMLIDV